MSDTKKQKITCPKCKKEIETELWEGLEMPYDREQKNAILNNTFFKVHCEDCGLQFPIAYRFTYNDCEQKYFIWLAPKMDEEEKKAIAEYNERLKNDTVLKLAYNGYTYRIVRNDNELREKVLIFDNGLDDRYIETMKLIYFPSLKKSIPEDTKIVGLYFDEKPGGGYQWAIITDHQQLMFANINMDIYEDMTYQLSEFVEAKAPEGLALIHGPWAQEVLIAKAEAAKNMTE